MPTILFVCTANICRSPMAMALFQRKLQTRGMAAGWQVTSAGTWALEGKPAAEHGQTLMKELGMDLSAHRARTVTGPMLEDADLILTMEHNQKEAMCAEFPAEAPRIFLLSELSGYPRDVPDPYGGPLEEYRETAQEISGYIDKGFPRMLELARRVAAHGD